MDHSQASDLMASEKYLLDELAADEREAFEDHLFGCHECAMDVRAGSVFLAQSRLELARPATGRVATDVYRPERSWSWGFAAFAIPAMAILAIVVGYQNLVTYPALKSAVAENRAPRILPAAALVRSANRGLASATTVRAGEPFFLPLEITSGTAFDSYRVELHNPAQSVEWSLPVSAESVKNAVTIAVPGVNVAGRYEIVVIGLSTQGQASEVGRYAFELQFAGAANP